MLTKEQILRADDLSREKVEIPEWGGVVFVRTLSGTERDAWELRLSSIREKGVGDIRASLAVACVVDESGKRLFADSDIAELGKKSWKPLDRIFDVAMRLNKMREEDVEELAKN